MVVLHNDEINTQAGVVYVLNRVLGMAPATGVAAARDSQQRGETELVSYPDRSDAEGLVVSLQLYGLHCTARVRR